mmetsp:Transcript_6781/g.21343  ORF Transcript_6781/g.21343 Transcript_6781/m.21343 type:complete len:240 (+) Transcript_6781:636-1355(+)
MPRGRTAAKSCTSSSSDRRPTTRAPTTMKSPRARSSEGFRRPRGTVARDAAAPRNIRVAAAASSRRAPISAPRRTSGSPRGLVGAAATRRRPCNCEYSRRRPPEVATATRASSMRDRSGNSDANSPAGWRGRLPLGSTPRRLATLSCRRRDVRRRSRIDPRDGRQRSRVDAATLATLSRLYARRGLSADPRCVGFFEKRPKNSAAYVFWRWRFVPAAWRFLVRAWRPRGGRAACANYNS